MTLYNSKNSYGQVSIILHWLMAIGLIGMYLLGSYMTQLDFYHPWYHLAPHVHKSMGVVLSILLVLRIIWGFLQIHPSPLGNTEYLRIMAKMAHILLYLLTIGLVFSGYLLSTSKGQGIDVFNVFELPPPQFNNTNLGELAADVHESVSTVFIVLITLHAIAAISHHFVFKDNTLKRMLWTNNPAPTPFINVTNPKDRETL